LFLQGYKSKLMSNLFYDLPVEIIRKIFEFDSTYRENYIEVLDSLPLVSRIQPFPGSERFIFVLVTKQHSPLTKENLRYYMSLRGENDFECLLETRRDAILEKTLTKAIFSFRKKFKL
jgi:hypothetical protein